MSDVQIECVYPISGYYGVSTRALFYTLLIVAICARKPFWLVAGATAVTLAYSGTAAIHAFILAVLRHHPVADLDIFGAWSVLSTSYGVILPFVHISIAVRESRAKSIIIYWAVLITVGTICAAVAIFDRLGSGRGEPACLSSDGVLLTSPSQLSASAFQCTYKCFTAPQRPLRAKSEVMAFTTKDDADRQTLHMLTFIFACLHSAVLLLAYPCQTQTARLAYAYNLWSIFFLFIGLNETGLLIRGGLPTKEPLYTIGQWAPCVGAGLVLVAYAISKCHSRRPDVSNYADEVPLAIQARIGALDKRTSGAAGASASASEGQGYVKSYETFSSSSSGNTTPHNGSFDEEAVITAAEIKL